jgi:hypothetical protein
MTRGRTTGYPQQVGLELHQQVVHASAAIDPQFAHAAIRQVAAHRLQQGSALVGDALQRGARDVCHGRAAAETENGAARVGLPVRRAEAGEGRHEHHAAAVRHAFGEVSVPRRCR